MKKWTFDIYNNKSEYVESIFIIADDYQDAVEQAEWYVSKRKQWCWIDYEHVQVESFNFDEDEARDVESDHTSA